MTLPQYGHHSWATLREQRLFLHSLVIHSESSRHEAPMGLRETPLQNGVILRDLFAELTSGTGELLTWPSSSRQVRSTAKSFSCSILAKEWCWSLKARGQFPFPFIDRHLSAFLMVASWDGAKFVCNQDRCNQLMCTQRMYSRTTLQAHCAYCSWTLMVLLVWTLTPILSEISIVLPCLWKPCESMRETRNLAILLR